MVSITKIQSLFSSIDYNLDIVPIKLKLIILLKRELNIAATGGPSGRTHSPPAAAAAAAASTTCRAGTSAAAAAAPGTYACVLKFKFPECDVYPKINTERPG